MTFPKERNCDFDWDDFDPSVYVSNNYSEVSSADAMVIEKLAEFYRTKKAPQDVLEVGVGPNLYPLLAALPVAGRVVALELAKSNLEYLHSQLVTPSPYWKNFWSKLSGLSKMYSDIAEPFEELKRTTEIQRGSIFNLEPMSTDLASMHFVAESITADEREFRSACQSFIKSVRPGGAFVASFMTQSLGYKIGHAWFPAVFINNQEIRSAFNMDGINALVHSITAPQIREGHGGMSMVIGEVIG